MTKLIKFRITNYKSIVDSGDCYFSDGLSILAGKNESGKTSILEALEDFHQDNQIRDEAIPIGSEETPSVSVSLEIPATDLDKILEEAGKTPVGKDTLVTFTKEHGKNTYNLDNESRKALDIHNLYNETRNQVLESIKAVKIKLKASGSELKFPQYEKQLFSTYKAEAEAFKTANPSITDIEEEISKIGEVADKFYEQEKANTEFSQEFVKTHLPYFILFSSFEDEFPKAIPIAELETSEWAKDLQEVSSFDIKKMASTNQQEQANHENSVNVDFSEKFNKYWTQDKIKLQAKKDGVDINFWIVEDEKLYYPSQRSKGQQWYLSFYIKIVARLQESKPNVILIDEPGLYLHAKAQKDLLQVLLEHTDDNPVVFSTHSPYLITEDNLENIRLVEKTKDGTKILGKIHAHPTADKETLTPVLTAIGLGINDSITNLDQKDNVVVEGPEDVFYLWAFKELEDNDLKSNFINGGGAPNMGIVGTILEGWNANVLYLYDNDQGKKDGVKNLKAWKVLPEAIKTVLKKKDTTIADILSLPDYKKHVLENETLAYTSENSEYIKSINPKPDKVLIARKFLQNVRGGEITLDAESKENIKNLFEEIKFPKESDTEEVD
jgi:recombinational DNA repair ATPase RecF